MNPIKRYPAYLPVFFLLTLLLMVACESKMIDPEGTLKSQAEQYWTERLMNGNYEYTYKEELEDGLPPFADYQKKLKGMRRFGVSSVRVEKVKVEGDRGTVTLQVACRFPRVPTDIEVPMGDRWIIKGNQWKHVFEKKTE